MCAQRAALRKQSQSRYKNWGNTLEALREKKKRDRENRLAQIESAQRVIDSEEAVYQEQQRRAAIDWANRVQFQECERVKTFQSSLNMANVLKVAVAAGVVWCRLLVVLWLMLSWLSSLKVFVGWCS